MWNRVLPLNSSGKYRVIESEDQGGKKSFITLKPISHSWQSRLFKIGFWIAISTVLIASGFFMAIVYLKIVPSPAFGTFETGFTTENVILPSSRIKLEQLRFTGGVSFSADGTETLHLNPKYVGEPSDNIDDAWTDLIGNHYFSVSEEEAKQMWGDEYEQFRDKVNTGFTGTLDMLHALHCLNQLRQALRRDYYPETPLRGMIHQLHCIDHLRQHIQCSGSSTISPTQWYDGKGGGYGGQYINPRQLYTCRNFDLLQGFSRARCNGSLYVPRPRDLI